ncbi:DUF3566 domain-containing protein [Kitasatospora sp. NPDC088346]|uniref:DUF3566 domain-containing protein n=1 Tax=Kitasatospora sp. NPDC088346 TaxID=3364073 RepID=UPI003821315A
MSGATGAGGATGGLPGGAPYGGGVPPRPTEHPTAASTSLMPPVGAAGQSGGVTYGGQAAAPAGGGTDGFSTPTTYTKGQPTPARGTRVPGAAPRRPGTPAAASPGGARTRKARLRIVKADPWSVMKVSFLLSLAVGVILIVAAAVLWMTLDGLGVFDSLSSTLKDVTGNDSAGSFNLMDFIGFGRVMMFTFLIAVVDVVLMTALATLSAFIYNTAAGFTGGVELTLAEED